MTLRIYTAHVSTRDPDRFDVTRKSATGDGVAFAPSWGILKPALDGMKDGREVAGFAQNPQDDLEGRYMQHRAWAVYYAAFLAEMRQSYALNRDAWERLLHRSRVCLVCYCTDPALCHRTILGADVFPKLGAVYEGEVFG